MFRLTSTVALVFAALVMPGCRREPSAVPGADPLAVSHSADSTQTISDRVATRPFPMVIYDRDDEELLRPYAERIAKLIGTTAVQASDHNPVCCVWIEITGWTPNPGSGGYIINHQPGGSLIQASDEDQLRLAIERFEATATRNGDRLEVPMGILTNYIVSSEAHAGTQ